MQRVSVKVPPPLKEEISEFQSETGYETESQAVRELLRRGLE
jgi:metal-responsive CopG/Arc/MetJ family transcriptional regulator